MQNYHLQLGCPPSLSAVVGSDVMITIVMILPNGVDVSFVSPQNTKLPRS
jgi:sRNA-binding carbon storage regulator CsrA